MSRKRTIAVDFDGTIVYDNYPDIGVLKPNVVQVLQRLKAEGWTIIINTCRAAEKEISDAKLTLMTNNIPYDFFNENDPEETKNYEVAAKKIFADVYVDDRNWGGIPDDWEEIYLGLTHIK